MSRAPPLGSQGRDDLAHFPDDLVRVYLGGAVSTGGELMRNLVPPALDRASCRVEDISAARRGTDVDGQHQWIECLAEFDSAARCRHGIHLPITRVSSGLFRPELALSVSTLMRIPATPVA